MTTLKKHMRWMAGPMAAVMFVTTSGIGAAQAGIVATDDVAQQQCAFRHRCAAVLALADLPGQRIRPSDRADVDCAA